MGNMSTVRSNEVVQRYFVDGSTIGDQCQKVVRQVILRRIQDALHNQPQVDYQTDID